MVGRFSATPRTAVKERKIQPGPYDTVQATCHLSGKSEASNRRYRSTLPYREPRTKPGIAADRGPFPSFGHSVILWSSFLPQSMNVGDAAVGRWVDFVAF